MKVQKLNESAARYQVLVDCIGRDNIVSEHETLQDAIESAKYEASLSYASNIRIKDMSDGLCWHEIENAEADLRDGLVNEAMTIAYSDGTIKRMIAQLKKEIEDYKQLIIDEPEDKVYWEEEIKKCEDEIADLESYEPLGEGMGSNEEYWAVYATDADTGTEYCSGVYGSEGDANYWAGMDRYADREYGYGKFNYRVSRVDDYTDDMDRSRSELTDLKLRNYDSRKLDESASKYFYVTIYEQSSVSGPEEGGYTSYGWEAVKSKSFRDEESARQYHSAYIANAAEVLDDNGRGRVHIRDEWGDEVLVCLEPAHKRGSNNSPALTWAQSELGHEPPQRAYFDRTGSRVLGNPREEAKKRKEQAALDQEFRNAVNAAGSREDLITVLTDRRFVKALSNNMDVVTAKLNEISSLKEDKERTAVINEDSELLPIEVLNPDGTPKQYDVTLMDPDRVAPKLSWDIADRLEDHFRNNNLWVDELHYNEPRNRIEFDINDGDWKHEHLRAKWLIEELFKSIGIRAEISSYTTEENGTDTFSAHYSVYSI